MIRSKKRDLVPSFLLISGLAILWAVGTAAGALADPVFSRIKAEECDSLWTDGGLQYAPPFRCKR